MNDGIKQVADVDGYCESMAKGVADKLWFTHHLDGPAFILDVGCADGAVLHQACIEHNVAGVGYDPYQPCIERGHRLYPFLPLTSSMGEAMCHIEEHRDNSANPVVMVLGTVLHEAYHNKVDDAVFEIIDQVKPDLIAVRDMGISNAEIVEKPTTEDADLLWRWGAERGSRLAMLDRIHIEFGSRKLGFLKSCLTAKHEANEVEWTENYFACNPWRLIDRMFNHAYRPTHFARYTPMFLRNWVRTEVGPDLLMGGYMTHFNLLVERMT